LAKKEDEPFFVFWKGVTHMTEFTRLIFSPLLYTKISRLFFEQYVSLCVKTKEIKIGSTFIMLVEKEG